MDEPWPEVAAVGHDRTINQIKPENMYGRLILIRDLQKIRNQFWTIVLLRSINIRYQMRHRAVVGSHLKMAARNYFNNGADSTVGLDSYD